MATVWLRQWSCSSRAMVSRLPARQRSPLPGPRRLWLVAVAHARLGQQMAGARRVSLQLAAQPGHVEPEVVGAALEAGPPDRVQQLARADQLARGGQQHPQ